MMAEAPSPRSEKSSAAHLKAVLDTVIDGILTIDERGTITTANPAAVRIFGYGLEEMLGNNVNMLMPQPYAREHDGYLNNYRSTGQKKIIGIGREVTGLRKDGSTFPLDLAVSEMRVEGQRMFTGIVRDITKRKETEQALIDAKNTAERANRTKASFLATMSHEIRTPLGGMLGMLELLGFTPLNDDQNEALKAARDSGQGLLRIVNDILDWSKIEAGKLELSPQPTSISQLIHSVVNTYSRVASANSLILGQSVDEQLAPAHIVDSLRLAQILNNFVSNALKFTPKGWVHVRAELVEGLEGAEKIRFSVSDTGVGIAPEVQARLFQAYSQESAETARMYGGTGLGLAICRRLADMLGGQIDLQSSPGLGSKFSLTLTLPVTEEASLKLTQTQMDADFVPQHMLGDVETDSPMVLVVDDHPINRKLLAIQLGLLGLRSETADNGQTALVKWRAGRFALVITDCHMPEMDGYELTQAIRKIEVEEKRVRTPIFAWTANALADETQLCHAAGMDELLIKPIVIMELHAALDKWLLSAQAPSESARPPPPVASSKPAPVDVSVLQALVGNKPEVIREFFQEFQHSATSVAAALRSAVQTGKLDAIRETAHKLKSPARSVGALFLSEICARIEEACKSSQGDGLPLLLDQFEIELAFVNRYMDSWQ
jgi:two-component system sensor histidine kinase EvgS